MSSEAGSVDECDAPSAELTTFNEFRHAGGLSSTLAAYERLCSLAGVDATKLQNELQRYRALRDYLYSRVWHSKELFDALERRAADGKIYDNGRVASRLRVLIVGAGPAGLRTAVEAAMLGASVVVVEKRIEFTRSNVLHMWPFAIDDLRRLGARKLTGALCVGEVEHINIRTLQCILLKLCLLLGVTIRQGVTFEGLAAPQHRSMFGLLRRNPDAGFGYHALFKPAGNSLTGQTFDVLVGAGGRHVGIRGFPRKEMGQSLSLAVTANFINRRTRADMDVKEISGLVSYARREFFEKLMRRGIELENLVYYRDDTHYFVMTVKKTSLLAKGVLKKDLHTAEALLNSKNVNQKALQAFAKEVASISTDLPRLDFQMRSPKQPDLALFDFTRMYQCHNAARVLQKAGKRLLVALVGDSLVEPFWPTGTGAARAFLSAMDVGWTIRSYALRRDPVELLVERENLYLALLVSQPDTLQKDTSSFTLDPSSRYMSIKKDSISKEDAQALISKDLPMAETDYPDGIESSSDDLLLELTFVEGLEWTGGDEDSSESDQQEAK